jgi:hypothetical protein
MPQFSQAAAECLLLLPAADEVSGAGEANDALPCARISHDSAGLTGSWRNGQAFPLVHKPRAK